MSNDYSFVSKSCAPSSETIKWEDGNEYPLIKLEISHKSHPFFTGKMQLVDTLEELINLKTDTQIKRNKFLIIHLFFIINKLTFKIGLI